MDQQCYYRVSVKGLVFDDQGRVLLAREDNGKWEMMGGGLDHDEDPIAGLKREILEETGLEVTYVSERPVYFLTAQRSGSPTFMANIIYEIKLRNLNFTPSEECQELRFFSPDDMDTVELFPNVKRLQAILRAQQHKLTIL